MRRLGLALAALALLAGAARAGEGAGLHAARMVDVRIGAVVQSPVILVEGERITAVGPGLAIPTGARRIELGDVTLLPGLIDAHTHLLSDKAGFGEDAGLAEVAGMTTAQR